VLALLKKGNCVALWNSPASKKIKGLTKFWRAEKFYGFQEQPFVLASKKK